MKIWAILLGLPALLPSHRVAIVHFFEIDIIVMPDSDGLCVFDGIDRVQPTRYQVSDTGNRSLTSPARPAAPKSTILDSILYGISRMKYSDFVIHASSWSNLKKSPSLKATLIRKEKKSTYAEEFTPPSDLFSSFFDATNDSFKAGRKPEYPYHENYIGTSLKLVSFVKSIHDHGRLCNGNIIIRRNAVQLRRLTLKITVCYSEKKKCTVWELGTYKWSSSGKVVVPNRNRTAFVPDVLYSLACYMTPTTFVKSFTLSPYLEGLLSKYILYSKTSICESYFHWLGIMVPKWQKG